MKLLQNKKLKKKKKRTRREFSPGSNWLFKNRPRLHLSGSAVPVGGGWGGDRCSAPPWPLCPSPSWENRPVALGSLWVGPQFPICSPHRPTIRVGCERHGAGCRRGGGGAGVRGDRGAPTPGHLVSRYMDWVGRRACRRGLRGALKDQLSRTVMGGTWNGVSGENGLFQAAPVTPSPVTIYN